MISIAGSRWKTVLVLIGSLVFVAGGVGMVCLGDRKGVRDFETRAAGAVSILFFGACAGVAVWQLFEQRAKIVIDDHGVLDRTLGVGPIAWRDIEHDVADPDRYLANASPLRRALASANVALGYTPLTINLSLLAADPDEVFELILRRLELARIDAEDATPPQFQ
jgi:hypothetical protein